MAGRSSTSNISVNQRTKISSPQHLDYTTVITTAATSWLSPEVIFTTLTDYAKMGFPFASHAPVNPMDGQLYLFDKNVVKKYKDDGVNWLRKKTGIDRIQEIYASLYVDGEIQVTRWYTKCRDYHPITNPLPLPSFSFHRLLNR